jgi:hypothetical protein
MLLEEGNRLQNVPWDVERAGVLRPLIRVVHHHPTADNPQVDRAQVGLQVLRTV